MSAQAPRQESLFPETIQGGYYPVLEGGYSMPIRRRAEFLLQALDHVSAVKSRTGFDDALEIPRHRAKIEDRYQVPEHDLEGHIRPGAKHNRAPLMRSYNSAFHAAYGDRGEALKSATSDMDARERAEFDIEMPEEEQASGDFRVRHVGSGNKNARKLLRKNLKNQLAILPVQEASDHQVAA